MHSNTIPVGDSTSQHDQAESVIHSTLSNSGGKSASWSLYGFLVIVSLFLSSALFTSIASFTLGDLSRVSKHLETWWEALGLVAWRTAELGVSWMMGFDGKTNITPNVQAIAVITRLKLGCDVASFTLLTHVPTWALLLHFYRARPTTIVTSLAIDLISITVPFILFQRQTTTTIPSKSSSNRKSNHDLIQDGQTMLFLSMAGSSIFAVFVYLSFSTWIPKFLVVHFDEIPDIRTVYAGAAGFPIWIITLLPAGYATYNLLFVGSTSWSFDGKEKHSFQGDNEGECLITPPYKRVWRKLFPTSGSLIIRTLTLATMTFLNTLVQLAGTIRGVDLVGASGWGAIWGAATLSIGAYFAWVDAVDDIAGFDEDGY